MIRNLTLYLLIPASLCLAIFLTSYSSGPAGSAGTDRTGAPFSNGTCNSCHFGGNYDASLDIQLIDGTESVQSYEPGKEYLLRIEVQTGSGNPGGYAFQAVIVDDKEEQAGSFSNAPNGVNTPTLRGRQYAEHSRVSTSSVFELNWTAPEEGTGAVTLYGAGNAVNGNGGTSGDDGTTASLTIEEGTSSALLAKRTEMVQVFPNPAQNWLQVPIVEEGAVHEITIFDVHGKRVLEDRQKSVGPMQVSLHNLPTGVYVGRIASKEQIRSFRFIKE